MLAEIVNSEIMKHLDFDAYRRVLNLEEVERAELIEKWRDGKHEPGGPASLSPGDPY